MSDDDFTKAVADWAIRDAQNIGAFPCVEVSFTDDSEFAVNPGSLAVSEIGRDVEVRVRLRDAHARPDIAMMLRSGEGVRFRPVPGVIWYVHTIEHESPPGAVIRMRGLAE